MASINDYAERSILSPADELVFAIESEYAVSDRLFGFHARLSGSIHAISPWNPPDYTESDVGDLLDARLACLHAESCYNKEIGPYNGVLRADDLDRSVVSG